MLFAQVDEIKEVNVVIQGNNKTKPEIIFRELSFSNGDTISLNLLEQKVNEVKANLVRTQLFNFVDISIVEKDDIFEFVIELQERWYYWAYPILEHSERNLSTFLYYRDWSRVNYGAAFDWYNFRGRDEVLKFKTRLGFKEHYSIAYHKPGFGKRRVDGLWVFTDFFRQKKTVSSIDSNLAVYTQDNQVYLRNLLDLGFEYTYRPKINYELNFGLKYYQYFYNHDIFLGTLNSCLNPKYIMPKVGFKYDSRNSIVYPTSGLFVNLRLAASLYGVVGFSNNLNITGVVQNSGSLNNSKIILRNEIFAGRFVSDNTKSVLFDELFDFNRKFVIRGYEYYYFPTQSIVGFKNTFAWKAFDLKFDVLPNVLPDEFSKFFSVVYFEAFADFAYSKSISHTNVFDDNFDQKLVYSVGTGVSVETYYDRLIQFHVAYNSCFKKFGIFAEFKTPIYKTY